MSKKDRSAIDKVFVLLGAAMTVVLLVASGLALFGYNFANNMVKDELTKQKIYFPEAGSAAITSLPEADQKEISKYAGQQLTTGLQAKVYANNFINVHLDKIAEGKTYAEVSDLAKKDPNNAKLQAQKASLFQGETLRGLLLGSGYAFWVFGMIAKYVAIAAIAGAGVMSVLVILGIRHLSKLG